MLRFFATPVGLTVLAALLVIVGVWQVAEGGTFLGVLMIALAAFTVVRVWIWPRFNGRR